MSDQPSKAAMEAAENITRCDDADRWPWIIDAAMKPERDAAGALAKAMEIISGGLITLHGTQAERDSINRAIEEANKELFQTAMNGFRCRIADEALAAYRAARGAANAS